MDKAAAFQNFLRYMIEKDYRYMGRVSSDMIAFSRDGNLFTNYVSCIGSGVFSEFTWNMKFGVAHEIKDKILKLNKHRVLIDKFGVHCAPMANLRNNEIYRVQLSPKRQLSIVRGHFTYGGEDGKWEIALMDDNEQIIYDEFDNIFQGDVVGHLTDEEVEHIISYLKSELNSKNKE